MTRHIALFLAAAWRRRLPLPARAWRPWEIAEMVKALREVEG